MRGHVSGMLAGSRKGGGDCNSESSPSATSRGTRPPATRRARPSGSRRSSRSPAAPTRSGSTCSRSASITTHPSSRPRRRHCLAHIAALTERIVFSTAVTLITTNDLVKIAEDYAMLQHLAGGRVDLMLGRGNTVPVYPWFGQDIRRVSRSRSSTTNLLHRLWREDVVDWEGKLPDAAAGLHVDPAPTRRRAPVRLARRDPDAGDRRAGRLLRQRVLSRTTSSRRTSTSCRS